MSGDARCKFCEQPVRWCRDNDGRNVALDATPSGDGQYAIVGPDQAALVSSEQRASHPRLYRRHDGKGGSCPRRDEASLFFRKRRVSRDAERARRMLAMTSERVR
jgi:hypothetical protein